MEESLRRADAELTNQFKRTPAFPMNKSYSTAMIRPFECDAVTVATLLSRCPSDQVSAMLRDKTKVILSSPLHSFP
jgi:hypothetical protein